MPQKKRITSPSDPLALPEQASAQLPEQPTPFHEHLRALTRSAVRVVIEEVMREELKQFLQADWGESTPERKGYRNGTYTRDLATASGPLEDLEVPRDREGAFHTQVFDRYSRYEPQVAQGLTEMFVAGVSTQKGGEVAQTLMGVAPSKRSVSRLNQTLTEQFETWRERALQAHWRILYLDGVHFNVHHGDQADSTIILTALGVDPEGNKEVLARLACAEESKDGWMDLLQDVRNRGATRIDLIVTDGHEGLLAAVSTLFTATPRQRCVIHKQRER
jgi:putative transposase